MSASDYRLLHVYLRDRAADRLVLTFTEIEDLLGSPLPPTARQSAQWWDTPDAGDPASPQADSWINAQRTATVTMASQRVLFERILTR
jgi:hypothetical protein